MSSDRFQKEYKKLNSQQREAVDAIDGPVMVIAGPGTGKTKVLTMRIVKILEEGLSPADGILCLTFTNSGVRAMRERLTEFT
ncbi:MAG: UvrD-helicase domain-containing protein, partial [Patescibacteria group bacterium]